MQLRLLEDEIPFQSLIGFKINWNFTPIDQKTFEQTFQSLIGFKINWNFASFGEELGLKNSFQSLIGFKINWNKCSNSA